MCSADKIKLATEDRAYVFKKTSFHITTAISLGVILVAVIFFFATIDIQCNNNTEEIEKLKGIHPALIEIELNLKSVCNKLKIDYVEVE